MTIIGEAFVALRPETDAFGTETQSKIGRAHV